LNSKFKYVLWITVVLLVVALDRYTKGLASSHLELHRPVELFTSLNLTLMHNTGVAFSMFDSNGSWQRWVFSLVALAVSIVIAVWLTRVQAGQRWLIVGLALVLGGAVGNLWDRVVNGYVVDFIDVYYRTWHWPAFNLADSAICVGAVMLVIDSLWLSRGGGEKLGD
jgi:signal peptidase II